MGACIVINVKSFRKRRGTSMHSQHLDFVHLLTINIKLDDTSQSDQRINMTVWTARAL
jgi:hypothetical protein